MKLNSMLKATLLFLCISAFAMVLSLQHKDEQRAANVYNITDKWYSIGLRSENIEDIVTSYDRIINVNSSKPKQNGANTNYIEEAQLLLADHFSSIRIAANKFGEIPLNLTKLQSCLVKPELHYFSLVITIVLIQIFLQLLHSEKSFPKYSKTCSWYFSNFTDNISVGKSLFRDGQRNHNSTSHSTLHSTSKCVIGALDRYHCRITACPLLSNYSYRLASYIAIRSNELYDGPSFMKLSDAGFYCESNGQVVRCEVCRKELDLGTLVRDSDPCNANFHLGDCSFARLESNHREVNSSNISDSLSDEGISTDVSRPKISDGSGQISTQTQLYGADRHESTLEDELENESLNNQQQTKSSVSEVCHESLDIQQQAKSSVSQVCHSGSGSLHNSATCDAGYASDYDSALVEAEDIIPENHTIISEAPMQTGDCVKNPGHFAYFPVSRLRLEQLPSRTRNPDVLEFLKLFSKLTVKLVVKRTIKQRHQHYTTKRVGTGFVSLEQGDGLLGPNRAGEGSDNGAWGTVKNYMKVLVRKDKGFIFIQTNRHLVCSDDGAISTKVEFCVEDISRISKKKVKVVSMDTSKSIDDNTCTLVCQISDKELYRQIQQVKREVLELAERLPTRAKKAMCKKIFIIEHPHGGEKVLSYGDSVMVKYQVLKDQKSNRVLLQRLKNNQQANISNARKMLLYAADTCPGSSGAPVITFKKLTSQEQYVLDVWTHNGQNKKHGLGCSVMKECTTRDFELIQSQLSSNDSDSEDEQSPGKQKVDSPVYKVLHSPTYPMYVAYQKRLESFGGWQYNYIHHPKNLAAAGFYFTGQGDCVRCFQCGLGLKTWKEGDDIYVQHEKHRPSCLFLQAQLKLKAAKQSSEQSTLSIDTMQPSQVLIEELISDNANYPGLLASVHDLQSSLQNDNSGNANVENKSNATKTLLERENEMLKDPLLCKVCHMSAVRDLFLPCGELSACSDCSKLLTHCPSCSKQILATVTVYFS